MPHGSGAHKLTFEMARMISLLKLSFPKIMMLERLMHNKSAFEATNHYIQTIISSLFYASNGFCAQTRRYRV